MEEIHHDIPLPVDFLFIPIDDLVVLADVAEQPMTEAQNVDPLWGPIAYGTTTVRVVIMFSPLI